MNKYIKFAIITHGREPMGRKRFAENMRPKEKVYLDERYSFLGVSFKSSRKRVVENAVLMHYRWNWNLNCAELISNG